MVYWECKRNYLGKKSIKEQGSNRQKIAIYLESSFKRKISSISNDSNTERLLLPLIFEYSTTNHKTIYQASSLCDRNRGYLAAI